jgi:transcriptional regulator with XRE-family HTH domain
MLYIRARRLAERRTAFETARAAEISAGRYSYIERGLVKPTGDERTRLADVFGVQASSLFRVVR